MALAAGAAVGLLTALPPATWLWAWGAAPAGMDAGRLQLLAAAVTALLASATWAVWRRSPLTGGWLGCGSIVIGVVVPAGVMAWDEPAPQGLAETVDWARLVANPLILGAAALVPVAAVLAAGSVVRRLRRLRPRHLLAPLAVLVAAPVTVTAAGPLFTYGPDYGVHHVLAAAGDTRGPSLPLAARRGRSCPGASSIQRLQVASRVLGQKRAIAVQLPPGYPSCAPADGYAVLYLLHGDTGTAMDWLNAGSQELADAGIAVGTGPLIVVYPDGSGGRWTDWADSRDHSWRMGAYLATELVAYVDSHYLTAASREQRYIAGLSSGGFGAASVALSHPLVFGGFGSFAGYYQARTASFPVPASASPDLLAGSLPADAVHAFIGVGTADGYAASARHFTGVLRARGWHVDHVEAPGGHGWPLWRSLLWRFLPDMQRWMAQPAPLGPRR